MSGKLWPDHMTYPFLKNGIFMLIVSRFFQYRKPRPANRITRAGTNKPTIKPVSLGKRSKHEVRFKSIWGWMCLMRTYGSFSSS